MLVNVQGEEEQCADINEPFNELRDQNIAEINGLYSFEIFKKMLELQLKISKK